MSVRIDAPERTAGLLERIRQDPEDRHSHVAARDAIHPARQRFRFVIRART